MSSVPRCVGCGSRCASVVLAAAPGDLRLVEAVKAGNAAAVQKLLAARAPVNEPEADGMTALHWAVRQDNEALVRQLLRAGATGVRGKPIRRDAARARGGQWQPEDNRTAARGRRESERRRARGRDGADDGGPHRQRGGGRTADHRRGACRRHREVARRNGADVGSR